MIRSDNGTNFVGADRELRECIERWNQDEILKILTQKGIQWLFNPQAAPHMGRVWKKLVRSCKRALNAVLKNQVLTDEVLATVMAEVESLVNNRALNEVSSDVDGLEAITPNHFLLGRPSANLPPRVFHDKEISSRKRWRQAQVVASHVWKRWIKEYLPGLIQRKKWHEDSRNVQVGDLVLIVDYTVARGAWPLATVVKVYPGADGVVRLTDVKTKFGQLKRPVTKLALLEECSSV